MFEGLDQIDWGSIDYPDYKDSKRIPNAIRNLLSQDSQVRNEARADLLGWGQEYGDITDITPHIIPYIFEILSHPDAPGKADLLDHLARGIWESEHLPVRTMRLYVKTYDTLKAGLDILISLLDDTSNAVRLGAIDFLQYLTEEVKVLLPEFKRHIQSEKEEEVQVALLRGLKFLLSTIGWPEFDLKEQYKHFLNEMIETHPSERIRVAGAQAAAETFERHFTREFPPKVADILSNHFWKTSRVIEQRGWSEEFDSALLLIRDLSKMEAADHLLEMFQNPEMTPVQAHLIARGLLAIFMIDPDDSYWKHHRDYYAKGREWTYVHSYPLANNIEIDLHHRDHFAPRLRVLEAIVENSKFWKLPTNMISFFIGLPDAQEQLRAILNSGDTPR